MITAAAIMAPPRLQPLPAHVWIEFRKLGSVAVWRGSDLMRYDTLVPDEKGAGKPEDGAAKVEDGLRGKQDTGKPEDGAAKVQNGSGEKGDAGKPEDKGKFYLALVCDPEGYPGKPEGGWILAIDEEGV